MNATALEAPPISGTIDETWFDVHGDATWVRFELDDGTSRAGAFGDGYVLHRRATGAAALGDGRTAVVLARGRGYVLDAVDREVLRILPGDTWSSVSAAPGRSFAVISDFNTLVAITRSGEIWRRERVALDGIIFDSADSEALLGKVWQGDGWYAFSLNFDGWLYTLGHRLTGDWSAYEDPSA